MTNPSGSADGSGSRRRRVGKEEAAAGRLEEVLRRARGQLEDAARAWISDLTAAQAVLRRGIGARRSQALSEALERLERLEVVLRQAPRQLVDHVGRRTALLASAGMAQLRRIDELEATQVELAAINVQLHEEISKRERLASGAREVERGLREVRERFESAFDNAPIGMAMIAMDDRWLQVNDALCRITGRTEQELKATTLRALTHPDDVEIDAQDLIQLLAGHIPSYHVEKRYRHAKGHHVWALVTVSLVRDDDRKPSYLVTQVQDITERKDLARHLEHFVDHDYLTGLYNRRRFEQELTKEIDRVARYGAPGAALVIDLDNFKDINDTFGHRAGDDVLKGVAEVLHERLRHTDIVARIGGDEFAVVLPQTDAEHAQSVADDLVRALGRQQVVLDDHSIHVTASIGVTLLDGMTDLEVLACADLALYEAKDAGRNRFAVNRPVAAGRERGSARLAEAERVRRALEDNRLTLHCQPILDLTTNQICQYELLLRLPDDRTGKVLPPSAFLYAAERFGLIQAIDGWVVRQAIDLIAQHMRAGLDLVLNVNLSGKSIGDRKLVELIETTLAEAEIDPARLILELTETAAIANFEEARDFASRLRGRGCRFALDDFGAGFGSFSYLKNFPFDYLKIDGEFIRGLTTSPVDQLVVEAIVGIARGMGKQTVGEFVADEETASLLRGLGVDHAQGYHIGMPRPVSEVLQREGASFS